MKDSLPPPRLKPLRVVLSDDEALSRDRLRQLLEADAAVQIVAECADGPATVEAIRRHRPDLAFLDVNLPGLDGFEVLEALVGVTLPAVIFVTAHDQFALRAFEVQAVDYLLKPFDRMRLHLAIERVREALPDRRTDGDTSRLSGMVAALVGESRQLKHLPVKEYGRISLIRVSEISWLASVDNYVELHVAGKQHLVRTTISTLAGQLPPQFIRISRFHLVNFDRVREICPRTHGDFAVILSDGTELAGTRNYRDGVARILGRNR